MRFLRPSFQRAEDESMGDLNGLSNSGVRVVIAGKWKRCRRSFGNVF